MCAASKKSKTQQLKERWEDGELDCGSITPEFIKELSPRELGMLGELITIDYFNERGYTLLEQGYRCAEGMSSADLRDYVVRGRSFRAWRESHMDDADAEAEDDESRSIDGVGSTFALDEAAEKCVLGLSKRTHLTGRGIVRLVRIARTIADVAESERVTQDHVLEAAMYQGRRDQ